MVAQAPSARPDRLPLGNEEAARRLEQAAKILEDRGENLFRVRAYRTAAGTVRALPRPAIDILREGGRRALMELPGIGERLSATLAELLVTGRMLQIEGLGKRPEDLIASIPGVGPELARRIHERLHVENLEELERAAYDGRLSQVPGMGPKRVRGIREALAGRFRRPVGGPVAGAPPVEDVLAVDAAYRDAASRGQLRLIAPRRFNPTGQAWLPILKTQRGGRRYRAMYSNTATAHRSGRERDWVVIFYEKDGATGQCTVVTETTGPLAGRRVIRGRETECAEHYGLLPETAPKIV
ncbi:MAG TPA: helix-hairpin-helix domain-containing protein [Gemmataceae bacterium]|nr:helix-hairpin-helix domain-containing protein [Gemmataceae bacterium]